MDGRGDPVSGVHAVEGRQTTRRHLISSRIPSFAKVRRSYSKLGGVLEPVHSRVSGRVPSPTPV